MVPLHPIAPDLAVAPQIDTSDIAALAERGYRTIINNRPDNEEPGQLAAATARQEAERRGLTYIHLPVTTGTLSAADVAAFRRAVQDNPKPIVAHCRSGTRCYLLWAAGQALDGGDPAALVDEAARRNFDLRVLPGIIDRLRHS